MSRCKEGTDRRLQERGTDYRPQGQPHRVDVHDFPDKTLGKVVPYGIYDVAENEGWISLAIDHDTSEFAVNAIRLWHERVGLLRYPEAGHLLITADCGGSNGVRVRLWKRELQRFADETSTTIEVCPIRPAPRSGTPSSIACSATSPRHGADSRSSIA